MIHLIGRCGSSSQNLPVAAQLGKIRIPTAPCDRHLPGILPPSFPTTVLQLHQPSCSFLNMLSSFPPQDLCTCCSFSFDCSSSTFLQDCFPHFIQVFVRCHLFRKDICDDFIYLCHTHDEENAPVSALFLGELSSQKSFNGVFLFQKERTYIPQSLYKRLLLK